MPGTSGACGTAYGPVDRHGKITKKAKPDICKLTSAGDNQEGTEGIKKLLGIHKDQTAIRIAIHGYLRATSRECMLRL